MSEHAAIRNLALRLSTIGGIAIGTLARSWWVVIVAVLATVVLSILDWRMVYQDADDVVPYGGWTGDDT